MKGGGEPSGYLHSHGNESARRRFAERGHGAPSSSAACSRCGSCCAKLVPISRSTHITDVYRRREAAIPVKPPADPTEALFTPPSTRWATGQR